MTSHSSSKSSVLCKLANSKNRLVARHGADLVARIVDLLSNLDHPDVRRRFDEFIAFNARFSAFRYTGRYNLMRVFLHFVEGMGIRPDDLYLATKRQWAQFGRTVKPEHLEVARFRRRNWQNADLDGAAGGPCSLFRPTFKQVEVEKEDGTTEIRQIHVGFSLFEVFDVSQTEGDTPFEVPPFGVPITGEDPQCGFDRLVVVAETIGFPVRVDVKLLGHGHTDFTNREIVVGEHLSPAAATKTLGHELGHALLHEPSDDPAVSCPSRPRRECEAELVGFLCAARFGIDSSSYSLDYLTSWRPDDPTELVAAVERALDAYSRVADILDADVSGEEAPDPAAVPALAD